MAFLKNVGNSLHKNARNQKSTFDLRWPINPIVFWRTQDIIIQNHSAEKTNLLWQEFFFNIQYLKKKVFESFQQIALIKNRVSSANCIAQWITLLLPNSLK